MADLNFQKKWGVAVTIPAVELASSVAFKYLSGKFMTKDGSNQYKLTDDGEIPEGWADVGEFTSNSTAGRNTVPLNISHECVFEMPVDETFTLAEAIIFMFKTCDIVVNSGIQQADIGASSDDVLLIVGYDVDAQTVFVKLAERTGVTARTGVA